MKNKYLRTGFGSVLPAIVLVFGLVVMGCGNTAKSPSKPVLPSAQTPTITVQPQGAGYHPGANANAISVTANTTDEGTLTYQWYKNTKNSTVGGTYIDGDISGETGTRYTPSIPASVTNDVVSYYYVVVTNTKNSTTASITSAIAAITVTNAPIVDAKEPIITTQPAGTSYMAGSATQALTVTANSTDGGTLSYAWYRNTVNSSTAGTPTAVSNSKNFFPATNSLTTFYYYVVVTSTNSKVNGTRTATATSNVVAIRVTPVPLTGTVTISGDAVVGNWLTAVTTALGGIGTISYEWTYGDSDTPKSTSSTYKVTSADLGKTIKVTVTRSLCTGEKSAQTLAVVLPALSGTVTISGGAAVGHTLTADTTALSGSGAIIYKWTHGDSEDAKGENKTYKVTSADLGKTIKVTVTRPGYTDARSAKTEAVIVPVTLNGNIITASSLATAGEVKAVLSAYLASASGGRSAANPIEVKINGVNENQLIYGSDGIGGLFSENTGGKYVSYDLSGSNLTTISYDYTYTRNNADKLVSLKLPNTLISIGSNAFKGCSSLTSVTIGNGVTSIGYYAFSYCYSLTAITVGSGNTSYKSSADGVLFNKAGTVLLQYPLGKTDTIYTIPYGVTSIGEDAFWGCSSLTSVTIPDSVKSIGYWAFRSCDNLTSVTIPSSVESIGYDAFSVCSGLTSVTIGNGVTSIGDGVFASCTSLTSITIPNSVTAIGDGVFAHCTSLTSITIPNSVTAIGSDNHNTYFFGAFEGCSGLTSVTIGNGVTSIGDSTFKDCSSLTSVTIPNSVKSIGDEAFRDCSRLSEVTIGRGVKSIGYEAFRGCSSLTSVTIPDSVESIGTYAFSGCNNLTSVTIGSGVTSISYNAFSYCDSLTAITVGSGNTSYKSSADGVLFNKAGTDLLQYPQGKTGTTYTIPNSVTSIGDRAFFGCSSLTSVTIPDSVESIGRSAFYGCSSLTSVTIPSSVTSIAYSAFAYCSNLTSVTMRPLSPPTLGSDAFSSTPSGAFSSTPAGFKIKVASALFDTYKNTTVSGWSNYKSRVVEE